MELDRNEAKEEIKRRVSMADFLQKSKGTDMYCCPFCGSGTREKHTGALKIYRDTNSWYCHECGAHGDVIDLYQQKTGANYSEALSELADQIGIFIKSTSHENSQEKERNMVDMPEKKENTSGKNFNDYYSACFDHIFDEPAKKYLEKRGISTETAVKFGLGYDPEADPIYAPGGYGEKKYPEPRIIVPVNENYYIPRAINASSQYPKPNPKGSKVSVFNEQVLYTPEVHEVFVVEGVFDALSVEQCGYSAIALNSVNQVGHFVEQLEKRPTKATLFICLDNDADESVRENVEKQKKTLEQGLKRLNISYVEANITGKYKDVNEFLQNEAEQCKATIKKVVDQDIRPDNVKIYVKTRLENEIDLYKEYIPTGYEKVDQDSGGLKNGLYCLAAIPSLGKTTFALQMADQIASDGHDVIFFSLEQSCLELVSKSLSRITMIQDGKNDGPVTSMQIRNGKTGPIHRNGEPLKELHEELDNGAVRMALAEYTNTVGDRLSIVEGNFSCDISFIRNYVQNYVARTRCRPIVFIDYLQILQPEELNGRKQTTKETVDMTVTELKRMSRSFSIPIIAISSVNRMNYTTPISYESLKESGSIEYGCDVIWGMQLHCLNEELFESEKNSVAKRERVEKAKAEDPREIDLVCLKNRFGKTGLKWSFKYYPAYDWFVESE